MTSKPNPELPEVLAEVNAHISEYASEANLHDDVWEFVCECGREGCEERVSLPLTVYEALRRSGDPVLAEGHSLSERVVRPAWARRLIKELSTRASGRRRR